MKKVFKANIYFLAIIILEIIMPFILAPIYKAVGLSDVRVMLFANHTVIFLLPAIIYIIITKSNIKETFRLNRLHFKDILLIIVISLISYPLMGCFSAITSLFFENNIGNFIGSISSTPYIVLLLLIAVMPAITEEVTLRGIVLSGYNNQSKFKAALMTGILFGIFHLDGQQFLYAAVLGFILAYIVRVTNSIFSSMLMHFIINGTSITISKFLLDSSESMVQAADELNLMNLSFDNKLMIMSSYIIIGIALGGLVFKLIKVLEKWNIERNPQLRIEEQALIANKENIINIPFILIVVVYLLFMFLSLYVFKI
ncbi:CPBP family intramembrane glutamic endopeptidase [Clostridium paraputrificum]|uniref:CPBP family intramembrane glutamic endopeptidase n=1 Tax=Clostridium TaxID=1485 RepID=UPI003D33EBD8